MGQEQSTNKRIFVVWMIMAVVLVLVVAGTAVVLTRSADKATQNTPSHSSDAGHKDDDHESTNLDQKALNQNTNKATITFTDEGFSPSLLSVQKGTVVTVVNKSSKSVQFSSDDHPTHTHNNEMNMPILVSGTSGSFTANTLGTHGYHDHIDDGKTGTLTVVN